MDLFSIEIKPYKTVFQQAQIANIIAIIGSYFLVRNGMYILSDFDLGKKSTSSVFIIIVIMGIVHTQYQKKKLTRISNIADFNIRVAEYEKLYKYRMLGFLFLCFASCLLFILTTRNTFFYYAIISEIIALCLYPSLLLFKRELKNDEIILY